MFAALSRHFWPADDEEPAVHLASHFEKAISQIVRLLYATTSHPHHLQRAPETKEEDVLLQFERLLFALVQ